MVYVDTSALLKRYITETNSDEFDAFFMARTPLAISRLTLVEMRCALARRRRNGEITSTLEEQAMDEVRTDIQDGVLAIHPVSDDQVVHALHLIDQVAPLPLRTLDALHLSAARHINASEFATADCNQAEAAKALGLTVSTFFPIKS
ncbi:MAG: type II toxin-antitoxin system VapC family toxin [Gammaproteobacteria bacterium]|nr:type II toxin-antitoxin system VapC family toxin [Gammaproteobacteria bacterium]